MVTNAEESLVFHQFTLCWLPGPSSRSMPPTETVHLRGGTDILALPVTVALVKGFSFSSVGRVALVPSCDRWLLASATGNEQ